jgi:alpha-L-fucosidase
VSDQVDEQLVFTTNGKKLYALRLAEPVAAFTIEATSGWKKYQVKSVKLLGSGATVKWSMTRAGLRITPPRDLGKSKYAWAFEIVTDKEQHHPNVIVTDADKAFEGTRKVDLEGRHNAK